MKPVFKYSLIVLIVGLIIGVGICWYLNTRSSSEKTAPTTVTADPTADWKTYSSDSQGIAFKYPGNYLVEDRTVADETRIRVSNHAGEDIFRDTIPSDYIAMSFSYGDISTSLKEREAYLTKQLPSVKKQMLVTADGSAVTYYVYYSSQAADFAEVNSSDRLAQILAYFTLSNGNTFTAQIDNYEWTPKAVDQQQVDFIVQLLKTVYAPSTTTASTADWKTYQNTTFGFKVKYPSDWNVDSSAIEKYTAPGQVFGNDSSVYIQIYQGPEEAMTRKIELGFGLTDATSLDNQLKLSATETYKYTETNRKTFYNIAWSFGKDSSYDIVNNNITSQWVSSDGWATKAYSGLSNNKIHVFVSGYHFTGPESSKFTGEMAALVEQVVGTFEFTN